MDPEFASGLNGHMATVFLELAFCPNVTVSYQVQSPAQTSSTLVAEASCEWHCLAGAPVMSPRNSPYPVLGFLFFFKKNVKACV